MPRKFLLLLALSATAWSVGAAEVADLSRDGWIIKVDAEPTVVDPARDFIVTLSVTAPEGTEVELPDLRDRFGGFSVAEDFEDPPTQGKDGRWTGVSRWRLTPEPCARRYRLAPFVLGSFHTLAVTFTPPPAREPVTGDYEVNPSRDLPPFSWKLAAWCLAALALLALVVCAIAWIARLVARRVKEARMSPIQRAYVELDRLLRKGLPGRGLYKDFYVELTMVVRRYVQRRYGIKAPNLTTEEFLRELAASNSQSAEQARNLTEFLESADLVKFAGVEATPQMADAATDKARGYLRTDSTIPAAASGA